MKMKTILLTLLSLLMLTSASYGPIKPSKLRNGDLFNITDTAAASEFARGIVGSTRGIDRAQVSHVAILCKEKGEWMVLEATSKHGVWLTPLADYIAEADRDAEGHPMILVGRVKKEVDIERSILNAKEHLGRRYDFTFDPSDEEMYCSELVQKSYVDKAGRLLFDPIPMSFHDEEGRILPYWIEYYLKRDLDVPEGEPGSNPGALSRNKKVDIIGRLTTN